MRLSPLTIAAGALAVLPTSHAFGGFGHITIAYLASNFVAPETTAYFQGLLRNDTADYLAGVATWADSVRYSKYFRWTSNFHFIDAKDDPPRACNVDLERDCKADGCVVTALANYTSRLLDASLPAYEHNVAARFVVHFVGDVHQPLHDEDVARGGNGIPVRFHGVELNLHHVWDSSIAEKLVGGVARRQPYRHARLWADSLTAEIRAGRFAGTTSRAWLDGLDIDDPTATALLWAREGNAHVCTTVLPEGPQAIRGQELGTTSYYDAAAPVIELQVARAGYRLAAWLDLIVARIKANETRRASSSSMGDL
ncbi:S1/P1 nuclease [Echria macrotheca]|uniref:S1/P1 nuclease n=1 Tax=Echria macrotheca TaxID=438768 RepID=A0AAJ0FEX6_9PEZI|nr:S1/P1 nuclease [Echria macrotheca]